MKKVIALIISITLIMGCHAEKTPAHEALLKHRFVLAKANIRSIQLNFDVPKAYIEFGENFKITGRMCNNFFGQASYENGILSSKELVSTKMRCVDDELNQLDFLIAEMLQKGAKLSLKDNKLILRSKQDKLIYQLNDQAE